MTGTTYAAEQYRRLLDEGYTLEVNRSATFLARGPLFYFVPPFDVPALRREVEARRAHDTECRECGATFPAPPIGRCPKCGGRYLRRI